MQNNTSSWNEKCRNATVSGCYSTKETSEYRLWRQLAVYYWKINMKKGSLMWTSWRSSF